MHDERHPLLDRVVFGLALLLAVIVLFYAAKSCVLRRPPAPADGRSAAARVPSRPAATESAVAELPPIRLLRAGSRRPDVPPPPSGKK